MGGRIILVTGGVRSGKSAFALTEATRVKGERAFIATAEPLDDEMRKRILDHRRARGDDWTTYEEPLRLSDVISEIRSPYKAIIVDCLTLWLSNMMLRGMPVEEESERLVEALKTAQAKTSGGRFFLVSNEVGMGIVPENELARTFRDRAGMLNQRVASLADDVYMLIAGIPVRIK